jgi:hypothetical protein
MPFPLSPPSNRLMCKANKSQKAQTGSGIFYQAAGKIRVCGGKTMKNAANQWTTVKNMHNFL